MRKVRSGMIPIQLTHGGVTDTLFGWSKRTGIDYNVLRMRVGYGWSPERTLTEPVERRRPKRTKAANIVPIRNKPTAPQSPPIPQGDVIIIKNPINPHGRLYVGPCERCYRGAAYWPNLQCDKCVAIQEKQRCA